MPGSLLVDLDGVVRRWDPRHDAAVEHAHGLPAGSIAAAAFGGECGLLEAVTGQITDSEWRTRVADRLSEWWGPSATAAVERWSTSAGAIDDEVVDVLRGARRSGWRIGLLTNATTRLRSDLVSLGVLGEFDVVVSSADLGVAKPDPRVFDLACDRLGVEPRGCLFVDDAARNVEAAREAGLTAHVFQDAGWLAHLMGVRPPGG